MPVNLPQRTQSLHPMFMHACTVLFGARVPVLHSALIQFRHYGNRLQGTAMRQQRVPHNDNMAFRAQR